jgi:hypothetical protein
MRVGVIASVSLRFRQKIKSTNLQRLEAQYAKGKQMLGSRKQPKKEPTSLVGWGDIIPQPCYRTGDGTISTRDSEEQPKVFGSSRCICNIDNETNQRHALRSEDEGATEFEFVGIVRKQEQHGRSKRIYRYCE